MMDNIDLSKYKIKEVVQEQDTNFNEAIKHLLEILNDRSIPENQKQSARNEYNHLMKLKQITTAPPKIIVEPK